MGDEIHNANVITLHRERVDESGVAQWVARIGPAGQGVSAVGTNEIEALVALTMSLHLDKWPFDQTWRPASFVPATPTASVVAPKYTVD